MFKRVILHPGFYFPFLGIAGTVIINIFLESGAVLYLSAVVMYLALLFLYYMSAAGTSRRAQEYTRPEQLSEDTLGDLVVLCLNFLYVILWLLVLPLYSEVSYTNPMYIGSLIFLLFTCGISFWEAYETVRAGAIGLHRTTEISGR